MIYSLSYNFNFSDLIPSEQKKYLQKEAWKFKRIFKFFRRYLYMYFTGQLKLERDSISSETKTILWINTTAPSLGDSLMDLSGRVLLKNYEVDLYTSSKNSILYKYDKIFKNVYDENNLNFDKNYDLIIVDSYSPRSMKIKNQYFKRTPFVGMYGFLNGFEIHRTYYSFFRLSSLLHEITDKSKMDLSMSIPSDVHVENLPDEFITIVIGAEWDFRKYKFWANVIEHILEDTHVVLVGSSNGIQESHILESKFVVHNYVGKLSIYETAYIISRASMQLCADGGLWHVACAFKIPTIVLFADCHLYINGMHYARNTEAQLCEVLYSDNEVSDIEYKSIVNAFYKLKGKI